ncbi:MAG: hypothetical protein ACE5FT_07425 [Candidatus Nanoarchaeia archaeon]
MSKSKIEIEPVSAIRMLFGYGLTIFGVALLLNTYLQASWTIGTITTVLGELLPNPTIALFTEATTGLPGFTEALTWFFMLLIQTLIGFFIATIGIRIAKR